MKKSTKLYNSITNINDKFIEEAQERQATNTTVKKYSWVKYGAAAACICLAVCAAAIPWGEQPTGELPTKQHTMLSALPESLNNSTPEQQQTPKTAANNAMPTVYKQNATAHKKHWTANHSVIYGNTSPTAGAGGILPGGALCQMPIGSDSDKQILTDKPPIHAKQVYAAPMVYVNDKLYINYLATESVAEREKDFVYLGKVESYTRNGAADPVPNQNFQANTPLIGSDINQCGDDVVIYMDAEDTYLLYKPVETVEKNEREQPSTTEEANPARTITTDNKDIKY